MIEALIATIAITLSCHIIMAVGLWHADTQSDDRHVAAFLLLTWVPFFNALMLGFFIYLMCWGYRKAKPRRRS